MHFVNTGLKWKGAEWGVAILGFSLAIAVFVDVYTDGNVVKRDLNPSSSLAQYTAWLPNQLRTEHAHLLLAVETGADNRTIELRGHRYLSVVDSFRKSVELKSLDGELKDQLADFVQTIPRTIWLITHLDEVNREALRHWLRVNAHSLVDFTLNLSRLQREQVEAEHARFMELSETYASLIKTLHWFVFAAILFASWMAWKLLRMLRERDRQNATQASILRLVDDGVLGIGPTGHVLFFNSRAESFLGHSLVRGCALPDTNTRNNCLTRHVQSLILDDSTGPVVRKSVESVGADGVRHYTLSVLSCSAQGGASQWHGFRIVTIRDVTFDVEAARQKAECEAQIAEAGRVMSYAVITGGIIHEINQPLAALRNYAHILRTSPEFMAAPASFRAIVGLMGEESDRITEIVRNVQLLGPQESRLDGSCRLAEAVEQSIRLLALGAQSAPAITVSSSGPDDILVRGSLPLIGQVIINLLRNALQASSVAGRAGARIFLRRAGDYAEVAVADFGSGVRPEAAARLFVPFASSSGKGMGLGLSICQRIARNLDGSISWENLEAGGAVFRFHVPLIEKGRLP